MWISIQLSTLMRIQIYLLKIMRIHATGSVTLVQSFGISVRKLSAGRLILYGSSISEVTHFHTILCSLSILFYF
jgi:hypothetical protein